MNKGFGGQNKGSHSGGGYSGKKGGNGHGGGSSGGYRNYHPPDAPAEMVAAVFNNTQGLGGTGAQSSSQFGYQSYTGQTSSGTMNPQLAAIPPPPPPIFLPPPPPILPGGTEQFGAMMPPHMGYPPGVGSSSETSSHQQANT